MPTNGDYPWERDEPKWSKRKRRPYTPPRSQGSQESYQRYLRSSSNRGTGTVGRRLVTLFLVVAAIAALVGYARHGPINSGSSQAVLQTTTNRGDQITTTRGGTSTIPNGYVAEPGPWQWRWVRVDNPPPGTPLYVRQRYRTIRYVPASP
jgi:hypothetical protein